MKNIKNVNIIFIILGIIFIILGLEVKKIDIIGFYIGLILISIGIVITIKNNKLKSNSNKNITIKNNNNPNLIKEVYFKAAGVTFDDRQSIFKKLVKDGIKDGYIEPYDNMSKKEIIDCYSEVYEANDISVKSIRLEPTTFENEDAIEIYIKDFNNDKEYLIGYVPKKDIKNTEEFLLLYQEHPEYTLKAEAYITGGKFKTSEYDEDKEKDVIITDERNYGLNINLKLFKKEN